MPWTPAFAGVTVMRGKGVELRDERRFVFETAQVQNDAARLDAADNRDRHRPQVARQALDRAAGTSCQRPQGQRRAWQQRNRERTAADLAFCFDQSDLCNAAESALDGGEQPLAERPDLLHRPGKQPQRGQALGEAIGVGVEPQHGLERREPDLVEAKGPFQRVAREPPDQLGAADDEPRLRAAQQLVAAVRDEVRAPRQRLRYGRFVWQPPTLEVDERTTAEILDKRDRMVAGESGELRGRRRRGEAVDGVVAGVYLENEAGLRPDRRGIIGKMR